MVSQSMMATLYASWPVLLATDQMRMRLGKAVFALKSLADRDFLRLYPVRAGWITALTGLLLTTSFAFVLGTMLRRRAALERLVAERTASLSAIKDRCEQLAEHSRSITWETNASGLFTYISPVAEKVLGYRPDENA
jgi:PAS domain-containing protein